MRGSDILVNGLAKSIGDGKSINIWNELWAGSRDTRLIPPVSSSISNEDFDLCNVSLLLDPITKQWWFDKVQEYINPHHCQSVLATPVSFQDKDRFLWNGTVNGDFSVKSAYHFIREGNVNGSSSKQSSFSVIYIKKLTRLYSLPSCSSSLVSM